MHRTRLALNQPRSNPPSFCSQTRAGRRSTHDVQSLQRQAIPSRTNEHHHQLDAKLRARAEVEGLTIEAYLERIARDQERAEEELEALALEGLRSGDSIEAYDAYWADKRRRLMERHKM